MLPITACDKCKLCEKRKKIVNGAGSIPCDVMIIGEAPGQIEDTTGIPFSGDVGNLLEETLRHIGLTRKKCYITTVVKCIPLDEKTKKSRLPTPGEIKACSEYLEEEIQKVKPKVIVALGNTALKRITNFSNITKTHGMLFNNEKYNCKVLASYHPSFILRNDSTTNRDNFIQDFLRLKAEISVGAGTVEHNYIVIETIEDFKDLISGIGRNEIVSVDTETTGLDFQKDRIIGISFSWKEFTGVYLPLSGMNEIPLWKPEELSYMMSEINTALVGKKCILQNSKFDFKMLKKLGINITNFYDTMLAFYLLDENVGHGLKDLVRRHFIDLADYETKLLPYLKSKDTSYSTIPTDILGYYGAADADATFRLYKISLDKLRTENLLTLYNNLMLPLSEVLRKVEETGVKLDIPYGRGLESTWRAELTIIEAELTKMSGGINIKSPLQLGKLLFKDLKLPVLKKTKKGASSVDVETLNFLAEKHPFPKLLLKYRELFKLLSVYIEGMLPKVDKDDRLHTSYNLASTVTGRLSSSEPNLQNIPRREDARKIFIPEKGCKLIGCDYSQIELRIFACYNNDPDLVSSFQKGEDIHTSVAAKVFNVTQEQVTPEQRSIAKVVNFGLIYGMGAPSLATQLNITKEAAQNYIDTYFKRYKQAYSWIQNVKRITESKECVVNMFERKRRLPEINSKNFALKCSAERQAVNALVQSTASDNVNLAAIRVDKILTEKNLKSRLVLLVHDELVYEVPDNEVEEMSIILRKTLEEVPEIIKNRICVPLTIDLQVMDYWS